jgi:DNA-binding LacI/PurR family transcriptional regulator
MAGAARIGEVPTGQRRPTIDDVARRAGVSKGAVSFALNGRPGVGHATRARILNAARALDWRPSTRARALSHSRAFALGLVISRSPELLAADPFFPHFVAGVETVLAGCGYALVLQVVGNDRRAEADSYRRLARDDRVDGVFLTDLRRHDPRFQLLVELGLPGVAVAVGSPGGCPLPWVAVQDRHGVEQAVAHLVELGHTRIGYVAGTPGYVHSASRRAAWRRALRRAGLVPGPVVAGDFTAPGGARATRQLLGQPDPPTAIVYGNDLMAIAGMGVALEAGLEVPSELSVVGFDDVPLAAHMTPPLTTVRQDALAWGEAAARVLLAVVEGQSVPTIQLDLPQLIVRASTAPPRQPKGRRRPDPWDHLEPTARSPAARGSDEHRLDAGGTTAFRPVEVRHARHP